MAGPVADAFGVQVWYVTGGLACILIGIGSYFVPALMHLEDNHRPKNPASINGELISEVVDVNRSSD